MKRILKLDSGCELEFDTSQLLGEAGTQGAVYQTQLMGVPVAVKVYHANAWTKIEARTRYLVKRADIQSIPNLCAPLAIGQCDSGEYAVLMPYVNAKALDQYLEEENPDITTRIELLIQFVQICSLLEERGFAHGDISYSNTVVDAATRQIYFIDLDNFITADTSVSPPPAFGTFEFMAPEMRRGFLEGDQTQVSTFYSERFSSAVIMAELLLNQHPAAEADNPGDFFNLMVSGRFPPVSG